MQIIYFPYLFLDRKEEIKINDVKLWNFLKKSQEYIPDEELRNKVKALLNTNRYGEKIIEDMAIFSIGNIDFRQATEDDLATANEIRLILFLAFLSQNNVKMDGANAGHYMATSENFAFVLQNFQLNSDSIGESAGYIVNRGVAGYKISETTFVAPGHVLKPLRIVFDSDLINALYKLKVDNSTEFNRILRAADLLFESYWNNSNVSLNARMLLQVGALEVLMNLSTERQRLRLKERIEAMAALPEDPIETYTFELGPTATQNETKSIKVKWADRFYTLRNHIIHGNVVPPTEFFFGDQRQIDISTMFFILLTKKILNEKLGERIFYDEIVWGKFKYADEIERDGFVYKDGSLHRYFATHTT